MNEPERTSSRGRVLLLGPIAGVVFLFVLVWLLTIVLPEGQFIYPFFMPAIYSVGAVVGLSIGFLAVGRFRVLPAPASYWMAVAFFAFGILSIFVVLTFPEVRPGGAGLIAGSPNTAALIGQIQMSILVMALILAATAPGPGRRKERTHIYTALLFAGVFLLIPATALLVRGEERLPRLIVEGAAYSRLMIGWVLVLLILLAGGAVLSMRRYAKTGDSLVGYVAITQIAFTFAIVTAHDVTRFTSLWYTSRLLGLAGLVATLFGLLYEYVILYQRERESRAQTLERAEQLRAILESMVDPVFVADAEGRVRITNQAARALLGLDEPDGEKLDVSALTKALLIRDLEGRELEPGDLPLALALKGEVTRFRDLIAKNLRTGRDTFFRTSSAPVIIEGRIAGAVAVGQDITQQIDLDRMKEDFIRVAAHELKTPVSIMKGYAQAMPSVLEQRPERLNEMVTAIDHGADRITDLVQDLLDISQLQVGELRLAQEDVELRGMLEGVVDRFSSLYPSHEVRLAPGEPVMARGDHDRLRQVASRLLENAIKFSPGGGPVDVSVEQQGGEAVVSVTDYGAGIPMERQEHIFERFFRAHAGTPLDLGGMGIGLHVSKRIIEAQGGKMWFESETDKGSTFYFSLPVMKDRNV
ncbi:MAG: ATP-binding protein [Myxococcota bacterium]